MTLDEFRKTRKERDSADAFRYANHWHLQFLGDRFTTGVEEFKTLEEAEIALYQMYCNEACLTEDY